MVNRNVVITLIIIALLAVGVMFAEPIAEGVDGAYRFLTGNKTMSTLVEFHDDDGNLVNVPMAIQAGGADVTTMTVEVSWVIEESGIQSDTFNLYAKIYVDCKDRAGVWQSIAMKTFPYITQLTSSRSITWTLVNILDMSLDDIGWELKIWGYLYATATDLNGDPVEVEKETAPIYPTLTWSMQTGTLSIIQCSVLETYA